MNRIYVSILFLVIPVLMGKSCNAYDPSTWDTDFTGQKLGGVGVTAKPLNKDAITNTTAFATNNSIGLLNARRDHTATLLLDGRVLVVGGESGGTAVGDAEVYEQGSGEFQKAGTLNSARMRHTATLLSNGNVIIAGGQDTQLNPLQSIEIYDPNLNSFTILLSNLSVPRFGHTATYFPGSGNIYFIGGFKDNNATPEATDTVDEYKPGPQGQQISSMDKMTYNRAHHAAALIPGPDRIMGTSDDRILVTYGLGSQKTGTTVTHILRNTFIVFDPTQAANSQWKTPQGVTGTASRWNHHAIQTLNANFDVIILAGINSGGATPYTSPQCGNSPRDDGSGPEASVEVYRPLETSSAPMPSATLPATAVASLPPPMQPFVGGAGSVALRHSKGGILVAAGVSLNPGPPCQRVYSRTGYLINISNADPAQWTITQIGLGFQAVQGAPQSSPPGPAPAAGQLTLANAFCAMSLLPGNDGFGGTTDDSMLICGGQESGPNQIQTADVYTFPDNLP